VGKVKKSGELTDVRRTTGSNRSSRKAAPPKASTRSRDAGAGKPAKAAKPASKTARKPASKPPKKAAAKSPKKKAGAKRAVRRVVKPAVKRAAVKRAVKKATKGTRKAAAAPAKREPQVHVRIRELDPVEKCGPGTSVERLIRVDEIVDRVIQAHLVFLDHHGWYCEHGQSCKAVGHARKHAQHVRSQFVGNGTHNGRMRA